ncbi:hypothetical protein BKA70DRAFT_1426245 [Coprinopsis sp. MPI-PUGE-AT-0042]|nr:hypothetical protein BKA70DRAFT_1426245 [Coprinopsis sp. MPI-PUGE-AT-0042]
MSTSCGNPATETDALMTPRLKFDRSKQCVKCKENPGNIVIRHAVYCKICFVPLIVTRFKKTLEPTVNPKPDGPRRKGLKAAGGVVIGYSGGLGSTVLLDIVAKSYFLAPPTETGKARGGTAHPRNAVGNDSSVWRGKPAVCYVELSNIVPGSKDRIEEAREVVKQYSTENDFDFEFIPVRIEDAFNEEWWGSLGEGDASSAVRSLGIDISDESLPLSSIATSSAVPPTPLLALQSYLGSLPTQTAKESAIQTLTRLLLLYTASSRGASHLLLGTSLTTLSINLISGISQGAGFSVSEESYEEWSHQSPNIPQQPADSNGKTPKPFKLRIVRPLRDIGMKECAFWMWWSRLPVVGKKRLSAGRQSIVSLTRDFIMGLEQDYPSTVSTIARTCAKVTPKEKSSTTCALCQRPAQSTAQEWKAQISIRSYADPSFAESGDTLPPHLEEFPQPNLPNHPDGLHLASKLCYACHTTLTSRSSKGPGHKPSNSTSDVVPMPTWVAATMGSGRELFSLRKQSNGELRQQIQGFILSD